MDARVLVVVIFLGLSLKSDTLVQHATKVNFHEANELHNSLKQLHESLHKRAATLWALIKSIENRKSKRKDQAMCLVIIPIGIGKKCLTV